MSDLSDKIEFDKPYELNIGKTFQPGSKSSFHQIKCKFFIVLKAYFVYYLLKFYLDDFTPASIDKNHEAKVSIGTKNEVQMQFPNIDVGFSKISF